MVSPPLGLAKGGKKQGSLSWASRADLQKALKKKSAAEVLSRSQETRPCARGVRSGPRRPRFRAQANFAGAGKVHAARSLRSGQEGTGQDGNAAREAAQAPEARAPGRVFPEAFGGGAAERKRLRACRRRGSFSPLLLCEGKGASPFHGLRPLRAPLRVFQAAATALGKMAVLSLVSE